MAWTVAVAGVVSILLLCGAALLASAELAVRWSALTGSTRLSVFLDPQLLRADAERLKLRIDAIPRVAGSILRTREDTLAQFVSAGFPELQTRANPLPDVWLVSLEPSPLDAGGSQADRVMRMRTALAALPGVQSVQVDTSWIGWIDRWSAVVLTVTQVVTGSAFGFATIASLGIFFLAGRAASRSGTATRGALLCAGLVGGLIAAAAATLLLRLAIASVPISDSVWHPASADVAMLGRLLIVGALAWLASGIGMMLGRK